MFELCIVTYCMNPSASWFFPFIMVLLFVHSLSILSFLLFHWNLDKEDKSANVFLSMAFLKWRFRHLLDILSLQTCRRKDLVLPLLVSAGDDR